MDRAAVLIEALPYIQRFRDAIVVVKFGGNAMESDEIVAGLAADLVLMRAVGLRPVLVHGGGPQIGEISARLGLTTTFRDGLRVTDAETLDVARMVLVGKVNRELVAALNLHGAVAVGVAGEDAGLISAEPRDPALGFVGDVAAVNPSLLNGLLAEDLIPVVSTIGAGADGQAYNINADAVAVGATKLVYLTDVPGLLADVDDPASLISSATVADIERMVESGTLTGGMIPKLDACCGAVTGGVPSVHILDGRAPHALLLELFTDTGIGTMISAEERNADGL
ncbi:MAG: acetylglutamate kinase [Actinobacteria bacterium]|nr:acetylglutamate kinase [Actinomycetota bacterium]